MNDSYVETTTEGWGGRIVNSIKGLIFGLILILGSIILLGWNEGRSVHTATALNEGEKETVAAPLDTVSPANEGKLVYLSGAAATTETLTDPTFGVALNGLQLRREVQMYQWKETKSENSQKNLGGSKTTTTTYDYAKVWSNSVIDSNNFKQRDGHQNPGAIPYPSQSWVAQDAKIGSYHLSPNLLSKLGGETPVPATANAPIASVKLFNGGFYGGTDPQNPQVGDVTIKFFGISPETVSVVAEQTGQNLAPHTSSNGVTVALIEPGVHTEEDLYNTARSHNSMLTWILRGVGFLLALFGFMILMAPLSIIGDVVPFIGSIIGAGTGLLSFLLAIVLSTVTIAVAWIAYRPAAAIALFVIAGGAFLLLVSRRKKRAVATT